LTVNQELTKTLFLSLLALSLCIYNTWASERRTQWVLRTADLVWCATPAGLVRFDMTTEVWESIVIPGVPEQIPIREIASDDGLIWLLTPDAVIQSDARHTQWIPYGAAEGIACGAPYGLVFGEEYVYLATSGGPGRFDRVVEEWELLLEDAGKFDTAAHVAQAGGYVWFTSRQGLLRYDPKVRAWQVFSEADGLLQETHYWLLEEPDELWAIGGGGIDIYHTGSRSWFRFVPTVEGSFPAVVDIEADGDILWVLTDGGIRWWDWEEHSDRPFPREVRLQGRAIYDIDIDGSRVVFASENSVVVLERNGVSEEWVYIDESLGLPRGTYLLVESVDDLLFLRHDRGIAVYSLELGEVIGEYPFLRPGVEAKEKVQFGPRIGDQGLEFRGWDRPLFSLKGSSTVFGVRNPGEEWDWRHRTSMSALRSFPGNRQLILSYDNSDLNRKRWGGAYRGSRDDNVRWIEGGNQVSVDFGGSRLLGTTGIKGGWVRLEDGPRSKVRGWRRATVDGWAGVQLEANAHEVFSGEGDVLYFLDHQNLVIGSARVWVDGDELSSGEYVLDHSSGTLSFLFPGRDLVDENSLIEVRYRYYLEDEEKPNIGGARLGISVNDRFGTGLVFQETEDGVQTGEVSGDAYLPLPNGELHIQPELAIQSVPEGSSPQAGFVEVAGRVGTVKIEGSWIGLDTAFQTLAVENSEFGQLREGGTVEALWEPRLWIGIGGQTGREIAVSGREDQWGGSVTLSPPGYPSIYGSFRHTDAWADSIVRQRDFWNGAIRAQLSRELLAPTGLTLVDFDVRSGYSEVSQWDPDNIASDSDHRTAQIWFRGRLASGSTVSLQPEYYWRRKDGRTGCGDEVGLLGLASNTGEADVVDWQPEEKRNRLRTTLYLVDVPEGVFTTARLEGDLRQYDYQPDSDDWTGYLARRLEFSLEAIPGIWWRGLNPFTVGLAVTVDRQDSLLGLWDDSDWMDVWGAAERSAWRQQTHTGRGEVRWRPDPRWLITQILSGTDTREVLLERHSSSTVEWSPRSTTRWVIRYQWTFDDFEHSAGADLTIQEPSVEWHQRWGGPWLTRCTLSGQVYDQETGGYQEGSLRNYVSATWRKLPGWGGVEVREEVALSIRNYEDQDRTTRRIINSIRGDWKPIREVFFRAEWRFTYEVDDDDSDISHRMELRMGVRF
jgi:hypothetical protein